jgi:hypothetical protein
VKDRGVGLGTVAAEIQAFIEAGDEYTEPGASGEGAADGRLKEERRALGRALGEASSMVGTLTKWIVASQAEPREIYKVGLTSRRVLLAVGDVLVGWLLQRQAAVALTALAADGVSNADRAFYQGKVAAATFFAHEVLPRLGADRRIVESTTLDLMDADEDVF